MAQGNKLLRVLTVLIAALVPQNVWAYISSPSGGSTVPVGGTATPVQVGGISGVPCVGVWGTIDGKTNSGTLVASCNVYYEPVGGGTAGAFATGPGSTVAPSLDPANVVGGPGVWPGSGTWINVNAWGAGANQGSTFFRV